MPKLGGMGSSPLSLWSKLLVISGDATCLPYLPRFALIGDARGGLCVCDEGVCVFATKEFVCLRRRSLCFLECPGIQPSNQYSNTGKTLSLPT